MSVFDPFKMTANINRAHTQFSDADRFLYRWAERHIADRLKDIKRSFKNVKIISDYPININGVDVNSASSTQPYDAVISVLNLHRHETPQAQLKDAFATLKPDGLFLSLFFGGDTLQELKQSLIKAETDISGGAHQRTTPLMTKQQAGTLMQSTGFALPVIDSERIIVDYEKLETLYKDLRAMGETQALSARPKKAPPKALFENTKAHYHNDHSENDKFIATFDVIFCAGWTPDESQQKPMRPGSAKTSLKDIL